MHAGVAYKAIHIVRTKKNTIFVVVYRRSANVCKCTYKLGAWWAIQLTKKNLLLLYYYFYLFLSNCSFFVTLCDIHCNSLRPNVSCIDDHKTSFK